MSNQEDITIQTMNAMGQTDEALGWIRDIRNRSDREIDMGDDRETYVSVGRDF